MSLLKIDNVAAKTTTYPKYNIKKVSLNPELEFTNDL